MGGSEQEVLGMWRRCLPRGSDELQVILLALRIDVDSVDGTESLNK